MGCLLGVGGLPTGVLGVGRALSTRKDTPISRSFPRRLQEAPRRLQEGVGQLGQGGPGVRSLGDSPQVTVPCPQVAVLTLTLFPVRLLVVVLMMLLAWPLALVSSLGPAGQEPEQPPALWRR